jgi:NAD-specific glutamate dehydrogenase
MTVDVDVEEFDYLDENSASQLRNNVMEILSKTKTGQHKLSITFKLKKSKLKFVFYDVGVSQMAYVDEFINNLLKLYRQREAFSHSRDHKVSMYYFLNKMHFQHRVRV